MDVVFFFHEIYVIVDKTNSLNLQWKLHALLWRLYSPQTSTMQEITTDQIGSTQYQEI